jgi:hypothetical protein
MTVERTNLDALKEVVAARKASYEDEGVDALLSPLGLGLEECQRLGAMC